MTIEDKEAIIRRLEAMYGEAEDNETKEALFYAIEALKEQRPHGKWLVSYECPNCGEIRNTPFEVCPQCKMVMKEGEKSECV